MTKLCLLASVLLASAIALPAAAQSPVAPNPVPLTATVVAPMIFAPSPTPPLPPTTFTLKGPDGKTMGSIHQGSPITISKEAEQYLALHKNTRLLAQSSQPCLKLRTYNFTALDLKSPHPHPSSKHDCTPLASVHLFQGPATAAPAIPGHAQMEPQATITPR